MTPEQAKKEYDEAVKFANSGYVLNSHVASGIRERAKEQYQRRLREACPQSDAQGKQSS
jgi:hypothetical protein